MAQMITCDIKILRNSVEDYVKELKKLSCWERRRKYKLQ